MTEQAKQDSQKTIVAFVAGLLIGGLLVYVFATPSNDEMVDENGETNTEEVADNNELTEIDDSDTTVDDNNTKGGDQPEMVTGEQGEIDVNDQAAGASVTIDGATFPSDEGWIGVRDYENDQLGRILGVARFSNEQSLIPTSIQLQRPTIAGKEYALVFYTESGDRVFSLADDKQTGDVVSTFTAE